MYDIFAKRIIQPTPFRVVEGETLLERALKALEKVRGGECEGRKTCVERLKWFQSSNADLSFNAFISPSPVLIHTDLVGFERYGCFPIPPPVSILYTDVLDNPVTSKLYAGNPTTSFRTSTKACELPTTSIMKTPPNTQVCLSYHPGKTLPAISSHASNPFRSASRALTPFCPLHSIEVLSPLPITLNL